MPARKRGISVKPIPTHHLVLFALLNLGRHGLRAAVNIVGIAVTVAALVFFLSFYRGTYEGIMFSSVIDYATSHGQFMSASFDDDDPDSWLDPTSLLDERLASGGAVLPASGSGANPALAPRLMAPAFAGGGSRKAAVTLAGVDFGREGRVMDIDARMLDGSFGGGVVIGRKLAETLSLSVGDEIRFQASTADGVTNLDYWKVSGIFSTGYPPMDRGMAFMPLADAQQFLSAEGKINKLYSRLPGAPGPVARERGIAALGTGAERYRLAGLGLVFKSWQNYARMIVEDARGDGIFYSIFIGILLFLSLSTMAGTMRVTVYERKREIGMLRSSGWMRGEIARLFLFEAIAIGVAGSVCGCALGGLASLALQLHPIEFIGAFENLNIPSFTFTCSLLPADLVLSLATGFLTATVAGIAPALTAARMPILSALAER